MSGLEPEQKLQEADQELPQQAAVVVESRATCVPRGLAAFRHRNYQLFFSGQLISLTGTWLQSVAQSWLVLTLVPRGQSELVMGTVSAISAVPILVFSFYAGILIDRFDKRKLILAAQISAMLLAFVLAALTHWHLVTIYHVAIIGFLLGTVNAFDAPARQSFVIEMVGREDLPNAIALNSAMFNGARIVGPSVAGIVIAIVGLAGAFFLNGVSFIAVIIGLLLIRVAYVPKTGGKSAMGELREGLRFIRGHRMIRALLMLAGVVSVFATPCMVLLPIFAKYNLHLGSKGLGFLSSSFGFGALIGAVTLSQLGNCSWKGRLLLVGNLVFCIMLVLLGFAHTLVTAQVVLVGVGWGMLTNMALTNTLIQTLVPDALGGRVMSVYTFMFLGLTPIGSMQAGLVADRLGVLWTIRIGAVICAVAALILSPRFVRGGATGTGESDAGNG